MASVKLKVKVKVIKGASEIASERFSENYKQKKALNSKYLPEQQQKKTIILILTYQTICLSQQKT